MDQATLIQNVVKNVLSQLQNGAPANGSANGQSQGYRGGSGGGAGGQGAFGIYADVDQAVMAAAESQKKLQEAGVEVRREICAMLRRIPTENAADWGRIELEETQVGRLDHKIAKLELLQSIPGVEFLETRAHTGDDGIGLDECAPWGVIGCVTPVTHSIPTLTANAINMIAAGNALVANAHPAGYRCATTAVRTYNQAIARTFGIKNLICVIDPPTLESAEAIFTHPDIPLLVVTGGPFVARAALKQAKRAIVAGPGNPPVVVDETADLDNAARSIIAGGSFDNNLLCIGEKEVFVVESVFDRMMDAMRRAGAQQLDRGQVDQLTAAAFEWKDDHYAVRKELV
ncbi:MAG: aldehyde dehydrogenase family protein, partial [Phycisphaeraceae bacterium]